jgi:hypothetical protein
MIVHIRLGLSGEHFDHPDEEHANQQRDYNRAADDDELPKLRIVADRQHELVEIHLFASRFLSLVER